ncbi:cysteine--tRNA ligase [Patescibacteria group bacterium]|nr:cysteine--tRNA ligase [Patescibacteria group bacterium]
MESARHAPRVFLTNSLSGSKELFIPLRPGTVSLYTCGPTVYSRQHIGNLRPGVFSDTLARTLTCAGYRVRRVINITDVGHLVGDGDTGEDKIDTGARREGLSASAIAERYTKSFLDDLAELNVDTKDIFFPRATEYIREQISLARTLEEKGFAYRIRDGLYFDTSRFPGYGALGGLGTAVLKAGARVETNPEKHHPADFVLWKKTSPDVHRLQEWDSPWGRGAPGWNIECSAMARALLGIEIDIHTGGEDLAQTHHNNEIAQSEAASGRPFVRYWMHNAFLNMEGEKISKSLGNVLYLSDIALKGYHLLSLRYFFLQAHYRTPLSFSWDALAGASGALERLWKLAREIARESGRRNAHSETRERFLATMRDDLATPQALGILWDSLKSEEYAPEEKWGLLEDAEMHLGLSLLSPPSPDILTGADIPKDIKNKLAAREAARNSRDFEEADRIRNAIEHGGYRVDDGPDGPVLTRAPL